MCLLLFCVRQPARIRTISVQSIKPGIVKRNLRQPTDDQSYLLLFIYLFLNDVRYFYLFNRLQVQSELRAADVSLLEISTTFGLKQHTVR